MYCKGSTFFQQFLSRLRGRGRRVIASSSGATSGEATPSGEDTGSGSRNVSQASTPSTDNVTDQASDSQEARPAIAAVPPQEEETAAVGATPSSTPGSEGFVHIADADNENDREAPVEAAATPSSPPESTCDEPDQPVLRQRRLAFFNRDQVESDTRINDAQSECTLNAKESSDGKNDSSEQAEFQSSPDLSAESNSTSQENEEEFAPLEGHIRIRLKYLDDRQRWVQAKPEDTIGQFKRSVDIFIIKEQFVDFFLSRSKFLLSGTTDVYLSIRSYYGSPHNFQIIAFHVSFLLFQDPFFIRDDWQ